MAGPGLVLASALLSLLPPSLAYCTWAGANPYWTGAPTVEQVRVASYMEWWRWLSSLILPPFSPLASRNSGQCGALIINQQQFTIITCSSQQCLLACSCSVTRSCSWAAPCRECLGWSQSRQLTATRVTLGNILC